MKKGNVIEETKYNIDDKKAGIIHTFINISKL